MSWWNAKYTNGNGDNVEDEHGKVWSTAAENIRFID